MILFYLCGAKKRDIAQLVARHVRDVEAGRSSRPISTLHKIKNANNADDTDFFG